MSRCSVHHARMKDVLHFGMCTVRLVKFNNSAGYHLPVLCCKVIGVMQCLVLWKLKLWPHWNYEAWKMHIFVNMLHRTKDWNPDRRSPVWKLPWNLIHLIHIFYFFLVHDMGRLSRVATVSSGIIQTVGESWSDKEDLWKNKNKNKKLISCSHCTIVSYFGTEFKVSQLQTFSPYSKRKEKKQKNIFIVRIVRCNGPKQGNRNTVEEWWWPPLLRLICRLFQGWVTQGEGQDVK